ncbi:MAG: EVE domain-containing protein [Candidatus Heimdallarchaeota archaeon]|nr:EVE domain-containing protein [Candidatus Heimdallarchaeota archaeon]
MTDYWIFIVTTHKTDEENFESEKILEKRMKDKFWGLGEKTPNRKNLKKGDKIVFYLGSPKKYFAGTATLATPSVDLSDKEQKELGQGIDFFSPKLGVYLKDVKKFKSPVPIENLIVHLDFIENKAYWGAHLQGAIRKIPKEDYDLITNPKKRMKLNLDQEVMIEEELRFALEDHLEEFLYQNWEKIDWGAKLKLYTVVEDTIEKENGRQFQAGNWSIDFLAVDQETNDLVVIELKRGKTSDRVIGQISRYIGWVKENIAEKDQNVRGIVISKEVNDALKYALTNIPNVEIKQYEVDFKLKAFE